VKRGNVLIFSEPLQPPRDDIYQYSQRWYGVWNQGMYDTASGLGAHICMDGPIISDRPALTQAYIFVSTLVVCNKDVGHAVP
jgi:hypothetical protein